MIDQEPVVISAAEPAEGREGTIVTLTGSGFATHPRNNCVVVGGMGACARPIGKPSATELQVRVGPVASVSEGEVLMWPGTGLELFTERLTSRDTAIAFSETTIFRNGAPVSSGKVRFSLTEASPDTYAGYVEPRAPLAVDLGGYERGTVMKLTLPADFSPQRARYVDICVVLKEPTLAIDFSAELSGQLDAEASLRAIAKAIMVNAGLVGERVQADVGRRDGSDQLELYITKPYLTTGMVCLHFSAKRRRAS
jgi:hypothetical protein